MTLMPLASARALLVRLQAEELNLDTELANDPRWLILPLAQRDELRTRHSILKRYHALKRPGAADAEKFAAEAGMKLRNFYRLYKVWASGGRTPLDLIPYQGLRGERKTKLANPETAAAITGLITEALAVEPMATPRKVIKHVKDKWNGPGELPSDVTLRNFHDRAVRDRKLEPGSLTINFSASPQEDVAQASKFGEALVIDHTAPARVLVDGATVTSPTITLAIDLWSGLPLGVAVSEGPPSTKSVMDALWDAQRRLEAILTIEKTVRPRIVYASTFEKEWDDFRSWFLKHDYDLIERRDVRLHHGGPIKRIIGSKLGDLALQSRLAGRANATGSIDTDTMALLNLEQMQHVLDVTIGNALLQGFTELGSDVGALLDLPPRLEVTNDLGDLAVFEKRKPEVDITEVLRRTREMLGDQMIAARITDEDQNEREYRIQVEIADRSQKASTWLALAAEAISIHKRHGVAIEFDVVAEKRTRQRSPRKARTGRPRSGSSS